MAKRKKPKQDSTPSGKSKLGRQVGNQMVDTPSPHVDAAMQSWQDGRFDEAFGLFRDAISREPNNATAYVMAARASAERLQYGRMEDILRKFVSRDPRQPGIHHSVGAVYGDINLLSRAITCFERAARLPGSQPQTWLELASLYESTYRLDEAQEMIERVVRSDFDYPEVDLVRGRIHRRLKEFDQAESCYHDVIRRSAGSIVASKAWGELALMWDRMGNYDGAVEAIGKCKEIQIAEEAPHVKASEQVHRRMEHVLENITRGHLERWRDEVSHLPDRRVSLLTGFPRSGTTLLEQAMDSHPDVISSEEHLFIGMEAARAWAHRDTEVLDVLDAMKPKHIKRARGQYFEAMEYALEQPIGARMHLDKNPGYNSSLPTQFRLFPETRLVVALRDPRDVVLSCYLRYLRLTDLSVQFLTPQRTAERYALDMRVWLKFREIIDVPWCEIRYEDTVSDLKCQVGRGLETLGLEWDDAVLRYRERLGREKLVASPNYEAVSEPIYTRAIGRWKHYAELLEPTFEALDPFISEFGYDT